MSLISKLRGKRPTADAQLTLTAGSRKKLKQRSGQRLLKAAESLQTDDIEAARQHLEWVQRAEHILAATARPPRKIYLAALVAFACVLLVGLALWLRTTDVAIQVELEVDDLAVRLTADRPWRAERLDIEAQRLRLSNVQNLDAPGLGLAGAVSAIALSTQAGEGEALLKLRALSVSEGAELLLSITDYPRIDIKDGVLEGAIDANHVRVDLEGGTASTDFAVQAPVPERLNFTTRRATRSPAQLMLESTVPWRFDGLLAQSVAFEREDPPHSSNWVSTVLGGSVRLLETNKQIALHEQDWLKLGAVASERLTVEFDPSKPDRFKLQLHGKMEKVETGPTGFVRNVAPTWLDYLYHQQHLALFWGAAGFLWGMFWSVRTLLTSVHI